MAEFTNAPENADFTVTVDSDIADLIPGFLENRRRDVTQLRTALQTADFKAVSFIGHTMKGAGAGYGFAVISEIGSFLESGGPAGEAAPLEAAVDRLSSYLDQVTVVYE